MLVWGLFAGLFVAGCPPHTDPHKRATPEEGRSTGALGGFVTGVRGEPLAGARVEVFPLSTEQAERLTTDADRRGAFRFAALPPVPHQLVFSHAGYGLADHTVSIRAGVEQLLHVSLRPAVELEGTVHTGFGAPLLGARVAVLGDTAAPLIELITDGSGRFHSAALAPGSYRLAVTAADHAPRKEKLELPAAPLTVRMTRLHAVTGRVARDARDEPRPEGEIAVRLIGGGPWPTRTSTAARDGTFRFLVPKGSYELVAFTTKPPWRASPILGGVEVGGKQQRSAKRAPTPILLRLQPAFRLAGKAVRSGKPIAGARVAVAPTLPTAFRLSALTRADGTFAVGPLLAGEYWTEVWSRGLLPDLGRKVRVPQGDQLIIELTPGKSLRGHVLDPAGQPIGGAVVRAQPQGAAGGPTFAGAGELGVVPGPVPPIPTQGRGAFVEALAAVHIWTAVSQPDGSFRLAGLPATQVRLLAEHPEHGEAQTGWIEPGARDLRLVLAAGAAIAGRVLTAAGHPLPGVAVLALSGQRRRSVTSDSLGYFRVAGLSGHVALQLRRKGYLPVDLQVQLSEGAKLQREITMESAGGDLRGQVLDGHGLPIAGAAVLATTAGRTPVRVEATADRAGRFLLPGIGGRACRVRASHDGHAATEQAVAAHVHYVQLMLRALQPVRGMVRSQRVGTPIGDFSVRLDEGSTKRVHHAGGEFSLTAAPGAHRLTISAAGYAPKTQVVRVPDETQLPVTVTFELQGAGAITGAVQEANGQPVAGALVRTPDAQTRTDAEGRFRLDAVAEGGQPITVVLADGRRLESTAVVRPNETTGPLRLILPPR